MKSIRTFLLALGASLLAFAPLSSAEPVVVVQSATSVTVDGQDYGQPIDAIRNNPDDPKDPTKPKIASAIQRALIEWATKRDRAAAAEKAALAAAAEASAKEQAAAAEEKEKTLKADHAKALFNRQAELAQANADAAAARALLAVLNKYAAQLPPEVVQAMAYYTAAEDDRELARLESAKAALAERKKARAKETK